MENHLTPTADDEIIGAEIFLPPGFSSLLPAEQIEAELSQETPNHHLRNTLIVAGAAGGVALFAAGTIAGRQVVRRHNH